MSNKEVVLLKEFRKEISVMQHLDHEWYIKIHKKKKTRAMVALLHHNDISGNNTNTNIKMNVNVDVHEHQ